MAGSIQLRKARHIGRFGRRFRERRSGRGQLIKLGLPALVATSGLVAALLLPVAAPGAGAAVPHDQVTVAVTGSLTSMTSDPSFRPAFSPSIHDYALYCQSGVNAMTLTFAGVTPTSVAISLGENQAAVVEASNGPFWIRCLPHDFPVMTATGSAGAVPGWYLTGNALASAGSNTYAMVLDGNGTPVWYQKAPGGAVNVEALAGDKIAWMALNGPGVGADPSVGYTAYDLGSQTTQTIKASVLPTDPHELLPMANGDYLLIGSPVRQTPVTFGGTSYSAIVDCVVQEVNPQGSLVWSWRASDHVSPASTVHASPASIGGRTVLDVYHCNSADVDPGTGQVLVSMRNTSAVYLVKRVNPSGALVQNGPVLWKLNGCGNSQPDPDHEQVLALQSDPEGCFDAQHDARFRPNGDVSIYDDHTYQQGGGARGVEYSIDTATSSATWDSQYQDQPAGGNGNATGSFRRYDNGSDNLVGWGLRAGSGFSEFDAAGHDFFSMRFTNSDAEYRVVKVPLNALDINALRASAGLPRPTFPTVRWATLGGVLTSKPAVAAWSTNRLDAFARGTDGQLWHRWHDASGWHGWEPLGGQLYPGTGPAVSSWAPGRLDVFLEGTDHQLWHRAFDSSGWHRWEPLGGVLTSGPAAASSGTGHLDVVVAGTDHAVWHKGYNSGWSSWLSLGGQTTADPGIASPAAGRADVFVMGTDAQLWHAIYSSGRRSGWESLGGNLTTGPGATSLSTGLLDVVAAGAAQVPERLSYSAGWQLWQPLRGATTQSPALVPFNGGEDVFVTGTDNKLWFGAISTAAAPSVAARVPSGSPADKQAMSRL